MKKLTYVLSFVLLTFGVWAKSQDIASTGTPDSNYGIYKVKLKKSNENLTDPKKNVSAKYWLSRAELHLDIFGLFRELIQKGNKEGAVIVLGNPKDKREWTEGNNKFKELTYEKITVIVKNGLIDSYVEKQKLHENPLPVVFEALSKCAELDIDKKLTKDILASFKRLKVFLQIKGGEDFGAVDTASNKIEYYTKSFNSFKMIADVNQNPIMEGVVDTLFLYYSGLVAAKANLLDESIKYLELAKANMFSMPDLYVHLKERYWEKGDTAKGLSVLEEGFARFSKIQGVNYQPIVIDMINYYLVKDRTDEALEYLHIAQNDDPTNLSLIFAEATLYDKLAKKELALATYQKCIDLDPEYFNAYYNKGVMYYNMAVEVYKIRDEENDLAKVKKLSEEADVFLRNALPYMEKAHELHPTDKGSVETLKTLYFRLKMTDLKMTEKYEEMKKKLEELKADAPVEEKKIQ